MDLQRRQEVLLETLDKIRQRLAQLSQELDQRQRQEQQTLGALVLLDELIAEANAPAEGSTSIGGPS
jgi:hypothetical protein